MRSGLVCRTGRANNNNLAAPSAAPEWGVKMHDLERVARVGRLISDKTGGGKQVYRIGDLAREFDVTLRTLRFYEDRGLISPDRDGSTRLYSERDRARLQVILLAKQVGFSLVEIQELLRVYEQYNEIDDPAAILLERFNEQMDVLQSQKAEIEAAIERLADTIQMFEQS